MDLLATKHSEEYSLGIKSESGDEDARARVTYADGVATKVEVFTVDTYGDDQIDFVFKDRDKLAQVAGVLTELAALLPEKVTKPAAPKKPRAKKAATKKKPAKKSRRSTSSSLGSYNSGPGYF